MMVPASRVLRVSAYPCENAGRMQARQLSGQGRFDAADQSVTLPVTSDAVSLAISTRPSTMLHRATDSRESVMAPNMAQKRAAKANRRTPIQHCLLCGEPSGSGMATLILTRGTTSYNLTLAGFLIDTWCLGVKDTFFRAIGAESFDDLVAKMEATGPVADVDPAYARKLLREITTWAASNGVAPHRGFAALEKLFGDVDADACSATFEFGRDGKPTYISGPHDSPAQVRFGLGAVEEAIVPRIGRALPESEGLEKQESDAA
jgi:hypothetical protein